jgi:hypothetical protein
VKSEIFKAYLRGQKDTTDTLINTFEEFQKLNGANAIMIDDVFDILNTLKGNVVKEKGDE